MRHRRSRTLYFRAWTSPLATSMKAPTTVVPTASTVWPCTQLSQVPVWEAFPWAPHHEMWHHTPTLQGSSSPGRQQSKDYTPTLQDSRDQGVHQTVNSQRTTGVPGNGEFLSPFCSIGCGPCTKLMQENRNSCSGRRKTYQHSNVPRKP